MSKTDSNDSTDEIPVKRPLLSFDGLRTAEDGFASEPQEGTVADSFPGDKPELVELHEVKTLLLHCLRTGGHVQSFVEACYNRLSPSDYKTVFDPLFVAEMLRTQKAQLMAGFEAKLSQVRAETAQPLEPASANRWTDVAQDATTSYGAPFDHATSYGAPFDQSQAYDPVSGTIKFAGKIHPWSFACDQLRALKLPIKPSSMYTGSLEFFDIWSLVTLIPSRTIESWLSLLARLEAGAEMFSADKDFLRSGVVIVLLKQAVNPFPLVALMAKALKKDDLERVLIDSVVSKLKDYAISHGLPPQEFVACLSGERGSKDCLLPFVPSKAELESKERSDKRMIDFDNVTREDIPNYDEISIGPDGFRVLRRSSLRWIEKSMYCAVANEKSTASLESLIFGVFGPDQAEEALEHPLIKNAVEKGKKSVARRKENVD